MAEEDFYAPAKSGLERLFTNVGKNAYLEIAARKGFSEKLKQAIREGRDIVFAHLRRRPAILGFIQEEYTRSFITVEVKEKSPTLEDIYQAKLYKEVFDVKCAFLITGSTIPEELKRLCRTTYPILHSVGDDTYRFLVVAQFDKASNEFTEWFDQNPFEKPYYWNR
jgi:hypothetical protein